MTAELLAHLEELLERSPGIPRGLGRCAGSGEGVATQVVVSHPEALEGGSGGSSGSHFARGLCRSAGSGERVATQVVVGHPEALEGVSGRHFYFIFIF